MKFRFHNFNDQLNHCLLSTFLTIMFVVFSLLFTFNPAASAAVFNAIKDFFISSFDLSVVSISLENATNCTDL